MREREDAGGGSEESNWVDLKGEDMQSARSMMAVLVKDLRIKTKNKTKQKQNQL